MVVLLAMFTVSTVSPLPASSRSEAGVKYTDPAIEIDGKTGTLSMETSAHAKAALS